jgi:hypothetical protein
MFKWFKKVTVIATVVMVSNAFGTIAPVEMKQETPAYIIDIKYPQGFAINNINQTVQEYIEQTKKSFLNELSEDEDIPADAPGKTGIKVVYSIPYHTKTALSIRFDVSIYHKGAAHPINSVVIQNFIHGKKVELADLFLPGANYLNSIAKFCKQVITKKKISDDKWIMEGTKPTLENYNTWYFAHKSIGILFNTYQVAAYVYGPQTVEIPLPVISSILKPELIKQLWSN